MKETENKMKISVVIPTKNEENTIGEIIDKCRPYADELLMVDGHSRDKTREIAEKKGVRIVLDGGKGKGDGLRTAIKNVHGDIIVFIDADFSHDPDDIPKLVQPILEGRADHVTGSRMIGGSDELHGDFEKFLKMVGSDIITLGINYRFNVRLTDSQNGFRALLTKVAQELPLKENITTIEQEMIIKTLRRGYKMTEVPTHEYKRRSGKSVIKLRRVWFRYVYSWLRYLIAD
jgi:dolichol-phosphate hexosyltransferase